MRRIGARTYISARMESPVMYCLVQNQHEIFSRSRGLDQISYRWRSRHERLRTTGLLVSSSVAAPASTSPSAG